MPARRLKGAWYVDFRWEGQRIRRKSPVNSKGGAQQYEHVLRQRLLSGEPIVPHLESGSRADTFEQFAWQWFETYAQVNNKRSEQDSKEKHLRLHLVPHLGTRELSEVDHHEIELLKRHLLRKGLSKKSVNNTLAVLSKCLRTAERWGKLDKAPRVEWLRTRSTRVEFLTEPECHRLLTACTTVSWKQATPWATMMLTALRTGLRLGELLGLLWENVNLDRRLITVEQTYVHGRLETPKNHQIRHVPIASDLCGALSQMRRPSGLLFSRNGAPLTHGQAGWAMRRAREQAGVDKATWHVLRHSFASHLVMKGIPIVSVKELLGHSDIRMTMRYAHLAPSHLLDSVEVLSTPMLLGGDCRGLHLGTRHRDSLPVQQRDPHNSANGTQKAGVLPAH